MPFEKSFFQGETICDFYVPPMMKRVWAGQLDMLQVIDTLCRAAGIRYYAAYGTLLGAVRHHGFIPWDDDIDLWMFRDDLMRFAELAEQILPQYGLELITPYNEPDYNNPIFGVFNGRHTDLSEERLSKYYGCPFSMRIDLFALDNLPEDEELIMEKFRLSKEAWELAEIWEDPLVSSAQKQLRLRILTEAVGYELIEEIPVKQQLSMLCDLVTASDGLDESEYVANVQAFRYNPKTRFRREWFGEPVYLEFEGRKIPAPADYDAVLRMIYKDYMTPVKGKSVHGYPFYKEQMEDLHRAFRDKGMEIPEIFRE
ncbi:MAG: LicD family protein [Lachnospiraceae bacterium]|nr:LicD family protein [Lachnospiraceae bacterium]